MLDFVNNVIDAIDKSNLWIGVSLDLSNAFDSIDHDILLRKQSYYGINNEKKDLVWKLF